MSDKFEVVYPLGVPTMTDRDVAPSIPDLNGKVIGFLWNYGFRGNETFHIIEDELKKRYPDIKIIGYEYFGNLHEPTFEAQIMAELPGKLLATKCDAVIAGNGC